MFAGSTPITLYLAASLIGFATGTAISILLLILTVRTAKLRGETAAAFLFVTCCLIWNLSGLTHSIALTWGAPEQGRTALISLACQFTAAATWPLTVISLWKPLAASRWQRIRCMLLQVLAAVAGSVIVIGFWRGVLTDANCGSLYLLKESTPYNGAILLTLGIVIFRDRLVSQTMWLPSLAMLGGAFGATAATLTQQMLPFDPVVSDLLRAFSEQITLLIVLGAFFLFARFRFSDLFIRHSLRILLAALTAVALMLAYHSLSLLRFEGRLVDRQAAQACLEVLMAVPLLFVFTLVDRRIGECVNGWVFHAPNYRTLLRELMEQLTHLRTETEIIDAVETTARQSLDLRSAQLVALEKLASLEEVSATGMLKSNLPKLAWMDAVSDGELVELDRNDPYHARNDVELLVPVRSEGRVSHVIAVSAGLARRGLVTHEVDYLRSVAAQLGHRLDTLRTEERMVAVRSRESVLQQQVTEAELRALRAQVNPHFLFNSLNSIANLVMTNPEQAETMTLRLARVFRHVLANSARPLIALHEEIAFLETYLQIEEARFGSRLRVSIAVDPAVALEPIPSLILQPIVENALKHGLGPKPGPGRLWISAEADGNQVRLRVEDDGVGPENGATILNGSLGQSTGVGLENVARRLSALYQDQGRMTMEVRQAGGTRVTIMLPREKGAAA
jgi:two-component system LytT family sensor kinase